MYIIINGVYAIKLLQVSFMLLLVGHEGKREKERERVPRKLLIIILFIIIKLCAC